MKRYSLLIMLLACMNLTTIAQDFYSEGLKFSTIQCIYAPIEQNVYVEEIDLTANCPFGQTTLYYRVVISYQASPSGYSELSLVDGTGQPVGTPIWSQMVGSRTEATYLLKPEEVLKRQIFAHLSIYGCSTIPALTYHCDAVGNPLKSESEEL